MRTSGTFHSAMVMQHIVLIWVLYTSSKVTSVVQSCFIQPTVHKIYPEDVYMGFGDAGLYRTKGVGLDLVCWHQSGSTDNSSTTQLLQGGNNNVISSKSGSLLLYTIYELEPGKVYWCKCATAGAELMSGTVPIPDLEPCDQHNCHEYIYPFCYQNTKRETIQWSSPSDLCVRHEFDGSLQRLQWNNGLMEADLFISFFENVFNVSSSDARFLYDNISHVSPMDPENLNNQLMCRSMILYPRRMCYLLQYLERGGRITPTTPIPTFRSHFECNDLVPTPGGIGTLQLDLYPLYFNLTERVVLGGTYYADSTAAVMFGTSCANESHQQTVLQCSLYTWTRATSIRHASTLIIPTQSRPCYRCRYPGTCNYQHFEIPISNFIADEDAIFLVGCTLFNEAMYRWPADNKLLMGKFTLPLYRQVEFYIHIIRPVQHPTYPSKCTVRESNLISDGEIGLSDDGQCWCVLTIISCDPLKTVKYFSTKMESCSTGHLSKGVPTSFTSVPHTPKLSTESAHSSGVTLAMAVALGAATFLCLTTIAILIAICICGRDKAQSTTRKVSSSGSAGTLEQEQISEPLRTDQFFTNLTQTEADMCKPEVAVEPPFSPPQPDSPAEREKSKSSSTEEQNHQTSK